MSDSWAPRGRRSSCCDSHGSLLNTVYTSDSFIGCTFLQWRVTTLAVQPLHWGLMRFKAKWLSRRLSNFSIRVAGPALILFLHTNGKEVPLNSKLWAYFFSIFVGKSTAVIITLIMIEAAESSSGLLAAPGPASLKFVCLEWINQHLFSTGLISSFIILFFSSYFKRTHTRTHMSDIWVCFLIVRGWVGRFVTLRRSPSYFRTATPWLVHRQERWGNRNNNGFVNPWGGHLTLCAPPWRTCFIAASLARSNTVWSMRLETH